MMQQTLRPYITTGIAVAGAALIATIPAALPLPHSGEQPRSTQQRAVTLAADPGDIITPYADLITNTFTNLATLVGHATDMPILTQLLSDPAGSLQHLPDVITLLTTWPPELSVISSGIPIEFLAALPPLLNTTVSAIGPLATTLDTFTAIMAQVFDFSDPGAALTALIDAPANLLNALLNGQTDLDAAGITVPLFNGLLTPGAAVDAPVTVGNLVNALGIGDLTVGDLADQSGLSDTSVASAIISALQAAGIPNATITDLANQSGLGGESVADLLIDLLKTEGIDNPTIAGLVNQLGFGSQTLGDLLNSAVQLITGGDPTITELLTQLGVISPDQTLGGVLIPLLDQAGIGQQTPYELINPIINPNPGDDITLGELVNNILQEQGMDLTLSQVVEQTGMSDTTVGELVNQAPYTPGPGDPIEPPGTTIGEMPWKNFLNSSLTGNMGEQTLKQLGHISDLQCTFLPIVSSYHCSDTLASFMGNKSVYDTLDGMHSAGSSMAGVPAGTSIAQMTLGQLVAGTGEGDEHLSTIVTNLNMDNPVSTILTDLGLDNVTIDEILTNGFPGLMNTAVMSVLSAWGLDTLQTSTAIDALGLTTTVSTVLGNLGLDDVYLNDVLNDLLGGVSVSDILNDLGMDSVYLYSVIDDLLGGVKIGTILDDLGVTSADVNGLVDALGLTDVDLLGVHSTDFSGLLPDLFVGVPQQIAAALAGAF